MAKRAAEEGLEEIAAADSPASKKARLQVIVDDADIPPPPLPPPLDEPNFPHGIVTSNGNSNTLNAAHPQHDELEEADALDDEDEDEDNTDIPPTSRQKEAAEGYQDLYLDTINRQILDFDFLRQCSITLSPQNVYACLVCGKYFSGRGLKTPAYFHALEVGHHVYINMETKKVYVLPEGYEVQSKSLDDIKSVVDPRFSPSQVRALDHRPAEPSWDLTGKKYHPGFVGLNNIKSNDYLNVIAQTLAHVPPLRNFLLLEDLTSRPQLIQQFSTLVRKIWNPKAFKSHVSPHELLQEISLRSQKKFLLNIQSDPADFLAWFLNNLHLALGGSKSKPQSSLIQKIFQGSLRVESQTITARAADTDAGPGGSERLRFEEDSTTIQSTTTPFTILTLDLPPAPLFQDGAAADEKKNIIPQVPLTSILQKYNGITAQDKLNNTRVRYRLMHPLPPYLILHIKRFQANKFLGAQRNPTIVTFNPRALDLSPYVEPNPELHPAGEPVVYDLVANVTYEGVKVRDDSVEGEAERKVWKVQMKEGSAGGGSGSGSGEAAGWWEMQDLFVQRVNADLLATKESYVMVWERRKKGRTSGEKR